MVPAQDHWKPVVSKDDLKKIAVNANQEWIKLPVQVGIRDVVSIQLSSKEVEKITAYGDSYFDKAFIDTRPSQWASSKGVNVRNPNTTGIKGEWAGLKHFTNDTCKLEEFLKDRPWRTSDMGDILIVGKTGKVFDYKTRTRKAPIEAMVGDSPIGDTYMAEMDAKFAQSKYKYLHGFIFCVNNEEANTIHLMGWMMADEFFAKAQRIPKGLPVPGATRTYDADTLFLPYRRLHPMSKLEGMKYFPITHDDTIVLKNQWLCFSENYDPYQYIQGVRDMSAAYTELATRPTTS